MKTVDVDMDSGYLLWGEWSALAHQENYKPSSIGMPLGAQEIPENNKWETGMGVWVNGL